MSDPPKVTSPDPFEDAPSFDQAREWLPPRRDGRSWRERLADLERSNGLWRDRPGAARTSVPPSAGEEARTHNWSPELGEWLPRPSDGDIERWIVRAKELPDLLRRAMFILLAEVERWRAREWLRDQRGTFDEAPTVVERPAAEALDTAVREVERLRTFAHPISGQVDHCRRADEAEAEVRRLQAQVGDFRAMAYNSDVEGMGYADKLTAAEAKVETLCAELAEVSGLLLDVHAYADLSRSKAHPVRERVKAWRERLAARKRTTTYHMVGCDARDGLPCTHDCAAHRYGPEKA